jgi:hypothetical protein
LTEQEKEEGNPQKSGENPDRKFGRAGNCARNSVTAKQKPSPKQCCTRNKGSVMGTNKKPNEVGRHQTDKANNPCDGNSGTAT